MKTPNWGYTVGILMMLFGGCSIIKDVQSIDTPKRLEMLKEVSKGMSEDMKSTKNDSITQQYIDSLNATLSKSKSKDNFTASFDKLLTISDFTKTWMVRFGYIGFIPSIIYILAGIFLLIRRRFSLKLAYGALALSILFNVIVQIVLSQNALSGSFITQIGFYEIFGIIIDIILIVVILASDKTAYSIDNSGNKITE